jgi:hypothetical protein
MEHAGKQQRSGSWAVPALETVLAPQEDLWCSVQGASGGGFFYGTDAW